ncbi:tRNA (adenine-N(6)-)-methyltransferase [Winogradskyella sp. PC-19]|uniref:tRNA1(Val) (adenine(37)-N6)-methyltransferase n=1 Tax=unclassified Winogradskyella TaxID=2615021 RepID=UPI000B3BF39E|nr:MULTISPECIES: methyltransferase [unclassified Winogradskyella]ARV10042.1 tRNA (adenine-N(6)-)-methyltransferase [Winogradskyella sp. PC-19]RZN79693.1 MAG: methyltransferase domain-containing protein [Winogradskyella sp.]
MGIKPFKFKEFSINQDRSAMKIGTDGVLLGAWTSIRNQPFSILDIGAGTGILSLMLAQRSNAQVIEAIEIDDNAYEQCADNFENSPWSDRLFCYHASLLEYTEEIEEQYDIIICNPPFYSEDYKTEKISRDLARFQDAMPFEHLIFSVSQFLAEGGVFSVVIPNKEEEKLVELASKVGLSPKRILHVKGNPEAEVKRSLIEFSFNDEELKTSELIIENDRHNYTEDYINLTKDFYLKM